MWVMVTNNVRSASEMILSFIERNYSRNEKINIVEEIEVLLGYEINILVENVVSYEYDELQNILSAVNEKSSERKKRGVYYTPSDVVDFTLRSSLSVFYGEEIGTDIDNSSKEIISKTVFDPTCGAGEFLLATLDYKIDFLKKSKSRIYLSDVQRLAGTLFGNDINVESVLITKLRLFLSLLYKFGPRKISNLANILNNNFTSYDYITEKLESKQFDIILGNPPYVEDSKSGLDLTEKYGNIYANVLENAAKQLKPDGVMGFIVPLSYVSTPRMKKIRNRLYELVPEQHILSYADRPDCLFVSVHQKLNILIAKKSSEKVIYTGNYTYWYKKEREKLFKDVHLCVNNFIEDGFIPKLGTLNDSIIFGKIISQDQSLFEISTNGEHSVYLNMRAAFWIKAFLVPKEGNEYKKLSYSDPLLANYVMCILNSSLFWWFWICISDCWHITQKELKAFKVPVNVDFEKVSNLAQNLQNKLEETKVYVGTKQIEYEYKHKFCIEEINAIDDYIGELFGLTISENDYIKKFATDYRMSKGG